jgi:hypothetical protein
MPFGSWPYLVKRGRLEVSPRVPGHQRVRKTAPSLGESFSIPLVEVPMFSTSPNMPKSRPPLRWWGISPTRKGSLSAVTPCLAHRLDPMIGTQCQSKSPMICATIAPKEKAFAQSLAVQIISTPAVSRRPGPGETVPESLSSPAAGPLGRRYFSAMRMAAGPPFILTRWPLSRSVEPSHWKTQ